jgi:molybdopterin molybdotransferase
MLPVSQAVERILARTTPNELETVSTIDAHGRVLGADAISQRALPPYDNSAMDGFAVRSDELPGTLPIGGVIAAGDVPGIELAPGTVLRIMTGSPLPNGADAVVMRENVEDAGTTATFAEPATVGRHIRQRGEDVAIGDVVVSAGSPLGPGELGALASVGLSSLAVRRRPTVGILATGNELVAVGTPPGEGQIVNSNELTLAAQVVEAGGVAVRRGIATDTLEAVTEAIRAGLEHDVLITSGGVSVGDFDHVRPALESLGVEIDFWKVAMKPGKPVVFGVAPSGTLVFGLPGNPV